MNERIKLKKGSSKIRKCYNREKGRVKKERINLWKDRMNEGENR